MNSIILFIVDAIVLIFIVLAILPLAILGVIYWIESHGRPDKIARRGLVIVGVLTFLGYMLHSHPIVTTRLDLLFTQELTSIEGNFSITVPTSWNMELGIRNLSPLKYELIRSDEGRRVYVRGRRLYYRILRGARGGDRGIETTCLHTSPFPGTHYLATPTHQRKSSTTRFWRIFEEARISINT